MIVWAKKKRVCRNWSKLIEKLKRSKFVEIWHGECRNLSIKVGVEQCRKFGLFVVVEICQNWSKGGEWKSCRILSKEKENSEKPGAESPQEPTKKTWGYPHTPRLPLLGLCSCTCTARWERGECALIDKGNTPTRKVLIDIIF